MSLSMDLKVYSFIKKNKLLGNGEAPVFMRFTMDQQRVEFGIKRSIDPKQWNKTRERVTGKSERAYEINQLIEQYDRKIHLIKELLNDEGIEVDVHRIKEKLLGKKKDRKTICNVFSEHNENARKLIGKGFASETVKRYETTLEHFQRFIKFKYNREDMTFVELTPQVIDNFEFYFKTERSCCHNTTMKYLKNFKKIVRIALKNSWISKDPFVDKKFSLEPVDAYYLTQQELDAIRYKSFSTKRLELVRDLYLFCCFTGLAFSDIRALRTKHISTDNQGNMWIHKKREKTGQLSIVFLLDAVKVLIEKYQIHPQIQCSDKVMPVPTNQKMNAYLKEIADLCGIEKPISTHTARHTFATTVTLGNNMPIEVVSKALGHSNIKMTQRYARTTEALIEKNMSKIAGL